MIRAHLLFGGVLGPDGVFDSAGMYALASMLGKIPGVTCRDYFWNNWQAAAQAIADEASSDKTIVIGYSGGGSRATWIANSGEPGKRPRIDLMVLYDPSPSWQMEPIADNVVKAICYHNTSPEMFVPGIGALGGGRLMAPHTALTTVDIAEQHLLVQADENLHRQTVAAVQSLAAGK